MSQCNKQLQLEGKCYPRTCAKCGWGKCVQIVTDERINAVDASSLIEVAHMFKALSFSEMYDLSETISQSVNHWKEEGQTCDPTDVARLLIGWAESAIKRKQQLESI